MPSPGRLPMSAKNKPRWKRILRIAGIVVLCVVALPAGLHYYFRWSAARNLQQAIAEADQLDPGWTLEELEDSRQIIPVEENGASKVLAVRELMPSGWPNRPLLFPVRIRRALYSETDTAEFEQKILELSPAVQLPAEILATLKNDLNNMAAALPEARRLADFSRGRYPIEYAPNLMDTSLLSKEALAVAKVLWADAILSAHDQQIDQALTSIRAILRAGRSIGDEPMMVSQELRLSIQRLAILALERVLAQGQPSREALEICRRLFEDEAAQPLLLQGYRAQRAGTHQLLAKTEAGQLRFKMRFYHGPLADDLPNDWQKYLDMVIVRRAHPGYLHLLTGLVEIAKLPPAEWQDRIQQLEEQARQMPVEFRSWFESNAQSAEQFQNYQAWLGCALAALAVEHYRLAHGSWPDSLGKVAPEFLKEVPTDPFDGRPLRFRRLDDGVIIYSIGPDRVDDGGKLERTAFVPAGKDVGVRLWSVERRRQPWQPAPKSNTDEEPAGREK